MYSIIINVHHPPSSIYDIIPRLSQRSIDIPILLVYSLPASCIELLTSIAGAVCVVFCPHRCFSCYPHCCHDGYMGTLTLMECISEKIFEGVLDVKRSSTALDERCHAESVLNCCCAPCLLRPLPARMIANIPCRPGYCCDEYV